MLLRYLSDVYKTLVQNVPEASRPRARGRLGFLLTTLRQVDSSLLDEWQAMREGPRVVEAAPSQQPPRRRDLAQHPKQLAARARAELHRLVALLSKKDFEEAAELLPAGDGWTPERLEAEAGLVAKEKGLDATPRARQTHLTQLVQDEPRVWTVRHTLLDREGEEAGWLEGVVDLRGAEDPDGALVHLMRIAADA